MQYNCTCLARARLRGLPCLLCAPRPKRECLPGLQSHPLQIMICCFIPADPRAISTHQKCHVGASNNMYGADLIQRSKIYGYWQQSIVGLPSYASAPCSMHSLQR